MAKSTTITAGIIGGAGYTGGELLRLLLNHPHTQLVYAVSQSQAGKAVSSLHTDLLGDTALVFSAEPTADVDVVFLCLPHGESKTYLQTHPFAPHTKIVDLSRDFRLTDAASFNDRSFVYGLPELQRDAIRQASAIANPGCFATAIQLGLLPLAAKDLLTHDVHTSATTGSTGAGQGLSATTHYTWRNNNLSVYQAFGHAHNAEIAQSLQQAGASTTSTVHFVPQRGSFTRGILATSSLPCEASPGEIEAWYSSYYEGHPFVHLVPQADVKQVCNTNKCFIQLVKQGNQLLVISVIDNLLKGASGQAVQNMNLMFGFAEKAGLNLKANVF